MKILVTGSSGFIGTALVKKLLKSGHKVIGMDFAPCNKDFVIDTKFQNYPYDFTDGTLIQHLIDTKDFDPDVCFHVGAIADVTTIPKYDIMQVIRTNTFGTSLIAYLCSKKKISMNYVSTCCIYGDTNEYPTKESSLTNPKDLYAHTKLAGEELIKGVAETSHTLNYNILRNSVTYGPDMRYSLAIYQFLSKALKNEVIFLHGDGLHTRPYIYVDDLIEAYVKILEKNIVNETINLSGSKFYTTKEVAEMCIELTNSKSQIKYTPDRVGNHLREEIDISKARNLLNWTPKIELKEGLTKTLKWMEAG